MDNSFKKVIENDKVSLHDLFTSLEFKNVAIPDMSVENSFFGDDKQHENIGEAIKIIETFQAKHRNCLLANGYLEKRAFYNTENFSRKGPNGLEFRNIHLGVDFWIPAKTPIAAIFDAEVVISYNNNIHKDYGPLIVLKHALNSIEFYTLYGHLSLDSLTLSPKEKFIKKGEVFGYIGNATENGHWAPHLHFQIITDLLGETENYNGVAFPSEIEKWKNLCPNPTLLFKENL